MSIYIFCKEACAIQSTGQVTMCRLLACGLMIDSCNAGVYHVDSPPLITEAPLNTTVIAGDSVRLECIATGAPQPSVTWTRGALFCFHLRQCHRIVCTLYKKLFSMPLSIFVEILRWFFLLCCSFIFCHITQKSRNGLWWNFGVSFGPWKKTNKFVKLLKLNDSLPFCPAVRNFFWARNKASIQSVKIAIGKSVLDLLSPGSERMP